jgi:hypothetical protein
MEECSVTELDARLAFIQRGKLVGETEGTDLIPCEICNTGRGV